MRHWDHSQDLGLALPVAPSARRVRRGQMAYHSGLAAEAIVERHYVSRGLTVLERRWRGPAGEIDLIFADGDAVVFVEVKAAKTFDQAAERVTLRQANRIAISAMVFLDTRPMGSLTDMRMDVALVDRTGAVDIRENAIADYW